MLERVQIEAFRGLYSVDVPLRPLTVLIGQNDTGKSSFLASLSFLLSPRAMGISDFWRGEAGRDVVLTGTFNTEHKLVLKHQPHASPHIDGHPVPGFPPHGAEALFVLPSSGVAMQCQGAAGGTQAPRLERDGSNVAAVLDYFLRQDRKRFDTIVEVMRHQIEGVENLAIDTPSPDERRIDLVIEGGLRIPAEQASTGVRLMIFFIALAYHPTPPKLILVEEPENGVHPRRLKEIMRLFHEITSGKHGAAAQVVLTTHSPYLLDHVDPAKDQVLVFSRASDGARTAEAVDATRLKTFLDEFMLGEVWFNQGEDGLVSRAG